jgi:YggT family protein
LIVRDVLVWVVTVYLVILAGRAVLSWFPVRQGTFLASLSSLLIDLTEPVLRPVRKVIPPAGMLDTSFIVVFFVLVILRSVLAAG